MVIVRGCQGQTGGQICKWASLMNVFVGLNRQFFVLFCMNKLFYLSIVYLSWCLCVAALSTLPNYDFQWNSLKWFFCFFCLGGSDFLKKKTKITLFPRCENDEPHLFFPFFPLKKILESVPLWGHISGMSDTATSWCSDANSEDIHGEQ